jgi:hypothetical protein
MVTLYKRIQEHGIDEGPNLLEADLFLYDQKDGRSIAL